MIVGSLQALVIHDLDDWTNALSSKFRCWKSGERAITQEEGTVFAFCTASGKYLRRCVDWGPTYICAASRIVNGRTRTAKN